MQSDEQLDYSLTSTTAWANEPVTGRTSSEVKRFELPSLERGKLSFSGMERNHLFLNQHGSDFQDISGISGLDSVQDSRSFAIWDYDRDGRQDIALLNINTPVLSLFRNQMDLVTSDQKRLGKMVALNFVGGNSTAQPSAEFGSRDGYGAKATVVLSDKKLIREHRCGEGLAAQNSSTMLIGIGDHDAVDSIKIDWPSGVTQQLNDISAGELVTVYEDPTHASDGTGFERSRYIVDGRPPNVSPASQFDQSKFSPAVKPSAKLSMYTSMATWCDNCKKQIPQLKRLREYFSIDQLNMIAVPVDLEDTEKKLTDYVAENQPPYELNVAWSDARRENFKSLINKQFDSDLLPATVIANQAGQILAILPGVPTVSETAKVLSSLQPTDSDSSK